MGWNPYYNNKGTKEVVGRDGSRLWLRFGVWVKGWDTGTRHAGGRAEIDSKALMCPLQERDPWQRLCEDGTEGDITLVQPRRADLLGKQQPALEIPVKSTAASCW